MLREANPLLGAPGRFYTGGGQRRASAGGLAGRCSLWHKAVLLGLVSN